MLIYRDSGFERKKHGGEGNPSAHEHYFDAPAIDLCALGHGVFEMKEEVKIGVIGLGGRGKGMLHTILCIEGVTVPAVCDNFEDRAAEAADAVEERLEYRPDVYLDYKQLLARDDLDAVLCCSTWITHSRIAADAMRTGKHVAIEVGGAASLEECWELVHTSRETGKFCMLLENCCYGRNEMALYNMKKQGILGEIIHVQGGYEHDLRDEICLGRENHHGRLANFMNRNGELYPTHQLGPIAKLLDINRGNRFLTLSAMSSKARGLHAWLKENKADDAELLKHVFTQGDVTTTMIQCAHGETILLVHDCSLPRPYSRNYRIHGTLGIYQEEGEKIYLEKSSPKRHEWEPFQPYKEQYEHPLWKDYLSVASLFGHDGMDFLVLNAFVESVKLDADAPIDVFDTAAWMAVTCLSEQSIAMGGMSVPVPDFTNGMWIAREPVRRGRYCLDAVCDEAFAEE